MDQRTFYHAIAVLYWVLGAVALIAFGAIFDKKADFFSSYMKIVCIGVLCVAVGASNFLIALGLKDRGDKSRKGANRSLFRHLAADAVPHLTVLDPFATMIFALTVVRVHVLHVLCFVNPINDYLSMIPKLLHNYHRIVSFHACLLCLLINPRPGTIIRGFRGTLRKWPSSKRFFCSLSAQHAVFCFFFCKTQSRQHDCATLRVSVVRVVAHVSLRMYV